MISVSKVVLFFTYFYHYFYYFYYVINFYNKIFIIRKVEETGFCRDYILDILIFSKNNWFVDILYLQSRTGIWDLSAVWQLTTRCLFWSEPKLFSLPFLDRTVPTTKKSKKMNKELGNLIWNDVKFPVALFFFSNALIAT